MTRTYHDVKAVTDLLSEKEKDLELAARIGQTLLSKNQTLSEQKDALEERLAEALEEVRFELADVRVMGSYRVVSGGPLLGVLCTLLSFGGHFRSNPVMSNHKHKNLVCWRDVWCQQLLCTGVGRKKTICRKQNFVFL